MNFRNIFIKVFNTMFMIMWLMFILLPILALVFGSFKGQEEFYNSSPYAIPNTFTLTNYFDAVLGGTFLSNLLITIILTVTSIFITTILSSSIAFIVERYDFKYKKKLLILFLIISLMPTIVMQVFIFQVVNNLHIYDTIFGLALLYSVGDIVAIYIFREYIRKIPETIDKSAHLVGATDIQIYFRIILPSLKPAIMLISMYKMILIYNDFYMQYLYLPTKKTISTYLYNFVGAYSIDWPVICATVVLSIIPVIIMLVIILKNLKSKINNINVK